MNPFPARRRPLDQRREDVPVFVIICKLVKYAVIAYILYAFAVPAFRLFTER